MKKLAEKTSGALFLLCALASVAAVLVICFFIFSNSIRAFTEIGPVEFLTGTTWKPTNVPPQFGIFYMLLGSLFVTAGALILGVPIGLLAAVFMARYCPKRIHRLVSQCVSLMAGVPSIIYGFFGMMVLVPFIQKHIGGNGNSVLAASVTLAVMILPTIISLSENALRAVPQAYYEGALALGATKEESMFQVVLPAARGGVLAAVVLGIGRAIGETMAVIMVAGNSNILPVNLLKPVRTLTANIVQEMSYASGLHYDALIATGAVLFVFILLLNLALNLLTKRKEAQ